MHHVVVVVIIVCYVVKAGVRTRTLGVSPNISVLCHSRPKLPKREYGSQKSIVDPYTESSQNERYNVLNILS